MGDPEVTFTVRPRPRSDDPRAIIEVVPPAVLGARQPEPPRASEVRHNDTFLGDLFFLLQFAFGRY